MIIKLASHHSKKRKKHKEPTISLQEFRDYNQHKDRMKFGGALGGLVGGIVLGDDHAHGLGSALGNIGGTVYAHSTGDPTRRKHYEKLTEHSD